MRFSVGGVPVQAHTIPANSEEEGGGRRVEG